MKGINRGVQLFVLLAIALMLVGCCAAPPGDALPEALGLTDQEVLDALAARSNQIQSVMSSGTMRLQTEDGGSVRLDVALLAQGRDRLRLRAWKLGRAVFDLTRDHETVWVWSAEQGNDPKNPDALAKLPTAEQIDLGWRLISGNFFASPPNELDASDKLVVTYNINPQQATDPGTARLTIDRTTQTIEQITIHDAKGMQHARYSSSRYRLIDALPWATRIAFESPAFAFEIELDEVELNGTLPSSAFTPPRDARKQP